MAYQSYTRTQLQALLASRWEGSPFWTGDDAIFALNFTLREWNAFTGYWRGRILAQVSPEDPYVPLLSTMTQEVSVSFQGLPLTLCGLQALGNAAPNWRRDTTTSTGISRPQVWARLGLGALVIWPAWPGQSQLEVDGVRMTPTLETPDAHVDIDDGLINVLLDEALHTAAFKVSGVLLERTASKHQAFLSAAVERNADLRATEWFRRMMRERTEQPEAVAADRAPE